jgi:hypothetical protein
MPVDLHYNEIARAIRRALQDGRSLLADTDGTAIVHASTDGLVPGVTVSVSDDETPAERGTVEEIVGPGEMRLDQTLSGVYEVARDAMLRPWRQGEPDLQWVGQGPVELIPEPRLLSFPCAVVRGSTIEQPLAGGTNRSYTQEYRYLVYYLQRIAADEAADERVMAEAGVVFRRLMADPYLGGTCWYSQVVRVEPHSKAEDMLRARGMPVRVVEMEMAVRRAETV